MRRPAVHTRIFPFLFVLLTLNACLPIHPAPPFTEPAPTRPVTPTPLSTPTIQWFPPTATLEPPIPPTVLPTEDLRPGLGDLLFQDDFSTLKSWSGLGKSSAGSTAIEKNSLILALFKPKVRMISVYTQPTPLQAYIEVTAQTNLCSATDEYGILLRYASNASLYRYTLSCDGQVQLARIADGVTTFPQPWTPSGAVPLGAPGITRLAVWCNGKEMRFFLNDQYQFTVRDPYPIAGRVGVFARSQSEKALNVSFSALKVFSINP